MGSPELQLADLTELATRRRLSSIFGVARGEPIVLVHLTSDDPGDTISARHELGTLPAVIVGIGPLDHSAGDLVDVIVDPHGGSGTDSNAIADAVAAQPLASVALCLLLRHGANRSTAAGLVAESTTYSMLQGGPEFAAWRARGRAGPPPPSTQAEVVIETESDMLTITLNRPHRHNAVDVRMSELLVEALTAALEHPTRHVVLRGAGPSFSSGGDLSEFGSYPDPATAHAVRLSRSAAQLVAMMAGRVEARLHGVCFGAGIELTAFAGNIVASPDTRIALPELSLGLIPGAGGTVSLPRRIGRHRTALLALTGMEIDATTAQSWGLIDRIIQR